MRGKFPSDLLVVVFGPLLVAAIVIGLGSFLFRAAQFRGSAAPFVVAAVAAALFVIVVLVAWLRRRRRS
jgi:uncharacterized membrane-anchored protein